MNQTEEENLDFIESRCVALRILQKEFTYVLLLQDDFFLDREPMYRLLESAVTFLQKMLGRFRRDLAKGAHTSLRRHTKQPRHTLHQQHVPNPKLRHDGCTSPIARVHQILGRYSRPHLSQP
jgi:hypothetical protein